MAVVFTEISRPANSDMTAPSMWNVGAVISRHNRRRGEKKPRIPHLSPERRRLAGRM